MKENRLTVATKNNLLNYLHMNSVFGYIELAAPP